ncbi:MAG: ribosomal protein L24e family protein [Candidatus Pacearchaeota archaeon]|nr:ribosomal protein L24e family protein [Candidatus Pacearchaeota archaeon]
MARCNFCSQDIEPGRGMIFVTMDGKILHFCSRKCRKSFEMGRSKKQGWLVKKRKAMGKGAESQGTGEQESKR